MGDDLQSLIRSELHVEPFQTGADPVVICRGPLYYLRFETEGETYHIKKFSNGNQFPFAEEVVPMQMIHEYLKKFRW